MVYSEQTTIDYLKACFTYMDGVLYWSKGKRRAGKRAGYINSDGYIEISAKFPNNRKYKFLAHRIIFAIHYNYFPSLVDHIDRNSSNNMLSNLRDATKSINAINTGIPANNKSGVKGVCKYKSTNRYTAQIVLNKRKKHLGYFNNIEDAKNAREKAEKLYWPNV